MDSVEASEAFDLGSIPSARTSDPEKTAAPRIPRRLRRNPEFPSVPDLTRTPTPFFRFSGSYARSIAANSLARCLLASGAWPETPALIASTDWTQRPPHASSSAHASAIPATAAPPTNRFRASGFAPLSRLAHPRSTARRGTRLTPAPHAKPPAQSRLSPPPARDNRGAYNCSSARPSRSAIRTPPRPHPQPRPPTSESHSHHARAPAARPRSSPSLRTPRAETSEVSFQHPNHPPIEMRIAFLFSLSALPPAALR